MKRVDFERNQYDLDAKYRQNIFFEPEPFGLRTLSTPL